MKTRKSEKTGTMKTSIGHDGGGNKSKWRRVMRILMNSVDILRGGISEVLGEMNLPFRWHRGLPSLTMMLIFCMALIAGPGEVSAYSILMDVDGAGVKGSGLVWEAPAETPGGDYTNWASDDAGDTVSMTTNATANDYAVVDLTDPGLTASDEIDSITVYMKCHAGGNGDYATYLMGMPGTPLTGAAVALGTGSLYALESHTFVNPGSWDFSNIADAQAGVISAGSSKDVWCSRVYATVNVKHQSLEAFVDDSTSQYPEQTDLILAKIGTEAFATGGGADITAAAVSIVGDISPIGDIKVWWKAGADDFASATDVGTKASPVAGTTYDITWGAGLAGDDSGYLYFTMSYPLGAEGSYFLNISSITGITHDNLPLPRQTVAQKALEPAQTLDAFRDYAKNFNKNADAPATDLVLANIRSNRTSTGRQLTSTNVGVFGTMTTQTPDLANIKVWWNTTDTPPPGGGTMVGIQSNVTANQQYEIALDQAVAGLNPGWLYYTITFDNSSATGSYFLNISTVTGISQDNLPLPMQTTENYATSKYYIQVCGDCHAYPPIDSLTRNTPSGAVFGVHSTHSRFNPMMCTTCHGDTTSGESDMAHRDGVIDINDTKMGAGGTYSKTFINQTSVPMTPGNCENLICHNGASYNRNWFAETSITCSNCHINAADTDDYVFRFFTSDNVPRLNQTEWEGSGHVRTGSNYPQSDNPPAAMGCPDCHDPTVPHGDPVIPYKNPCSK